MIGQIKKQIAEDLSPVLPPLKTSEIVSLLERPRDPAHGELALPIFKLAKSMKKPPVEISQLLAGKIQEQHFQWLESVEAVGGFLNFKIKILFLQNDLINSFRTDKIGFVSKGNGKTLVVEYSSPNVAKPMSIGHLRATVIGQALRNLAETQGYKVIGVNHIGDWGSQFGKLVWAYLSWGDEYDFKNKPFESLFAIYVRFHEEAKENPKLEAEGAAYFKKLEDGDEKIQKIWQHFREISINEYNRIYNLLGVRFDLIQGEAFYLPFLEETVQKLRDKGILEESKGAEVVYVGEDKPPCIIKKTDGASLYATRDIAAAIYRREVLKADGIIYVVGTDQTLHFQQVFKVLERMGYEWVKECHHIAFGMYRFKDSGKMSTRQGKVIFMDDVLFKAIATVREIIEKKNPNLKDKDKVSHQVGIGAIVFNDLLNDRVKNVDFDWAKVLDFEGDSGPYVQYTLVRCKSLLRKSGWDSELVINGELATNEEKKLVFRLLELDQVFESSYKKYKPNILAQYLLDVCFAFNQFYHKNKILNSSERESRLVLVKATERVLEQGLGVLGVPCPESM